MITTKLSLGQSYIDHFSNYDIFTGFTYSKATIIDVWDENQAKPFDTIKHSNASGIGPHVGMALNLPFKKFNNMSVGTHLGGYFYIVDGFGLSFPVMLQYRYGTDAVLEQSTDLGFALSAGYNFFFCSGDAIGSGKFYFPSISPEINFMTSRYGLFKIRLYCQLGKVQKDFIRLSDEIQYSYVSPPFVFSFGYCPNY